MIGASTRVRTHSGLRPPLSPATAGSASGFPFVFGLPASRRLRPCGMVRDLSIHGCRHEPEPCHPQPFDLLNPRPKCEAISPTISITPLAFWPRVRWGHAQRGTNEGRDAVRSGTSLVLKARLQQHRHEGES
jgi:hypothetical protein